VYVCERDSEREAVREGVPLYVERRQAIPVGLRTSYCVIAIAVLARAHIESTNGTKIEVEGTPEEVAKIIADVKKKETRQRAKEAMQGSGKSTNATDFVLELREQGFFDKPKTLASIKGKLAENGLIYPITSLSGVVLTQVRKKNLGRVKEKGRWAYVRR
jgi:hypothetical protein